MADIFQSIDGLDADAQQKVIDRLEFSGTYAPFVDAGSQCRRCRHGDFLK